MTVVVKNRHFPKRILICGLGSIGRRHARIMHHTFPGIELSAWRSGRGGESPELALMNHQFSDLDSAIAWKPDAAVICSPAPFHQHQALCLTRKRIPVLIEKPVGIGGEPHEGWDELVQHSKQVPIVIGYVLRHDPCAAYIKEKLIKKELGKVLEADFYCGSWLPDWRPGTDYRECVSSQRSLGGGVLLELSHEIDLARWFLGGFELAFSSHRHSGLLDIDVEDQVLLAGSSNGCSFITIRLNFCSRPPRRRVVIRCEKGEINWNLLMGNVTISNNYQEVQVFNPSMQADDRYRVQAKRFIECIFKGSPPHCSLNDGLQVLKLINHIQAKTNDQAVKSSIAS